MISSNKQKRMSDPEEWTVCSTGELQQLGKNLRASKRRERMTKAAQLSAWSFLLLAVGVFIGSMTMSDKGLPFKGGISCGECIGQFASYHSHSTHQAQMPADLAKRVERHLVDCEICRAEFEAAYPGIWNVDVLESNARLDLPCSPFHLLGEFVMATELLASTL